MQQKSRLAVQAFLMSLGTLASRVLGLVRESLFAAWFDREITDAWYIAFRLPNLFRRLFGEGALSVSFIPLFIESQKKNEAEGFFNSFFWVFTIFLLGFAILGIVLMPAFLPWFLDADYVAKSGPYALTLRMAQIMFFYVYLVCSYALVLGVLNTQGHFGLPALAPAFFNVVLILSQMLPESWQAWPGQALAWGVVVGGGVQLAILLPRLREQGYWPRWSWTWHPLVGQVGKKMLPSLLGLGVLQLMALVNLKYASRFSTGVISYLNLTDRIVELPLSLVSVSLASSLLPALSRHFQSTDWSSFISTAVGQLRLAYFLNTAAAVGLWILARPICEVLFQRGQFTPDQTQTTAELLQFQAAIVFFSGHVRVFVPVFYAVKNTWFPALVGAVCLVVHVVLAPWLMGYFAVQGLLLSMVCVSFLNGLLLAAGYYRWVHRSFDWFSFFRGSWKAVLAGAGMAGVLQLYFYVENPSWGFFAKSLGLGLFVTLGGISYLGLAWILGLPEAQSFVGMLRKRIKRS